MEWVKYVLALIFVIGAVITIVRIFKAVKVADLEANLISNIMNDSEILELLKTKGYL